jgi:hypothetical protein
LIGVFAGGFEKRRAQRVVICVVNRGEKCGKEGQKTVAKMDLKLRHGFEVYFSG